MDDKQYLANNPDWHSLDAPYKAEWIISMIDRWMCLVGKHVADVGCGSGEVLNELSQKYNSTFFHGYEISDCAFSICKSKEKIPYLVFHKSDLLSEKSDKVNFDLILCIDVFEHIPDYYRFLKNLKEFSNNFIFHIPLELSVQTIIRPSGLMAYKKRYGHLHFYNRSIALHILKDCGYTIIDWNYTPSALVLPGRNLKSRFLKIPRHILSFLNKNLCVNILGGFSLLVFCQKFVSKSKNV